MKTNYKLYAARVIITLILAVTFSSPTFSQEYKVRIAAVGNSITDAANLPSADRPVYGFPAQLQDMLSGIYGDSCEVKEYAVSGRNLLRKAPNPIWNESDFRYALEYVPDICLILLGTNDTKPWIWNSIGNEFKTDYLAMVDTFKFRNPNTKFIICFPPPIWPEHEFGGTVDSLRHNDSILVNYMIPVIDSVVKETGAILIDFHTPFVDSVNLFLPDYLHPNADGYYQMAKIIYDKMIETDLIHQVDAGLTFISQFRQTTGSVAVGSKVTLSWTTIFADSVFLDGELVDASGTIEVVAEAGKQYVLTAKSDRNTSTFPLTLDAYVPEKTSIKITPSSYAFQNGKPVTLYSIFYDQRSKKMADKSSSIVWSVLEGEGTFSDQTDSSVVFTPGAVESVKVEAKEGDVSGTYSRSVNPELYVSIPEKQAASVNIYPNPASESLNFRFEGNTASGIQISIFNILGEEIINRDIKAVSNYSGFEMDISGLEEGVYIYAVTAGKNVTFGKFLKSGNIGPGN